MSGTIKSIMPKRILDFSSVSSGRSVEIVLAQEIDVSQFCEATLIVRTFASSIGFGSVGTIGSISIYGYADGRTTDDPGLLFASTAQLGTITIDASSTVPSLSLAGLTGISSTVGGFLKIAASGTRADSSAGNQISASVSIDLALKTA